ncbi:hypothetical protein [[Pseudomonas] boreopolis]
MQRQQGVGSLLKMALKQCAGEVGIAGQGGFRDRPVFILERAVMRR